MDFSQIAKKYFQAERERQLDYHYMEDQRREWELKVSSIFMIIDNEIYFFKDEKQRQANEARHALMKRVYQIRDEQIKFKEAERQAEIEESQEERNRILHDVTSFKQSEVHRQNGMRSWFPPKNGR